MLYPEHGNSIAPLSVKNILNGETTRQSLLFSPQIIFILIKKQAK